MTNQEAQRAVTNNQYRPGVGIVLLNTRGDVFVGRRADLKEDAWQMPQSGIDNGEAPQQAAMRELKEEIGTNKADFIAESRGWFQYDVPPELAPKRWASRWKGQRQKWLVMLFSGADADIKISGNYPEFDAWRWVPRRGRTALHPRTDASSPCSRQGGCPGTRGRYGKKYEIEDMVSGDCLFAASGVTDGSTLRGVRFRKGIIETETLVMRSATGTLRRVKAEHHQREKFKLAWKH